MISEQCSCSSCFYCGTMLHNLVMSTHLFLKVTKKRRAAALLVGEERANLVEESGPRFMVL